MAICVVKTRSQLEGFNILAPERYDPRRDTYASSGVRTQTFPLTSIAKLIRKTVSATSEEISSCIVIDTSDSHEGILTLNKPSVATCQLGSTRKVIEPGDVIISRLRPYLRQVAFVDSEVPHWGEDVSLVCSTEYFVLRSTDSQSIAFLVPVLLSAPIQMILSAAQEGGHHPRFNETTLLSLPIKLSLVEQRAVVSAQVEDSVKLFRQSQSIMFRAVKGAESIANL